MKGKLSTRIRQRFKFSYNFKEILILSLFLTSLNAYSVVHIGPITQPNPSISRIQLVYQCTNFTSNDSYKCQLFYGKKTYNLPIQSGPLHYNPAPVTLEIEPGTKNVTLCLSMGNRCVESTSTTFTATGEDASNKVFIGAISQPNENEPIIKITYGCYSDTLSWYQCHLKVGNETFVIPKIQSSPSLPPHYQASVTKTVEPGAHNITLCTYTNGSRGSYVCTNATTKAFTVQSNTSKYKYEYDALGRLKKVENIGKSSSIYEYDDADNRTSKTTTKQ